MERLGSALLVLPFHGNLGDQVAPAIQKEELMKRILDRKNLPYFAAIVQAGLFSYAGMKFFGSFGWLVGFGVGMIVNYSLALAASHISDIAAKRKPLAYVALVAMFALSPVTITLSLFFPAQIYTAVAWAMCVDLSIILAGAIAGKSLIPAEPLPKVARKKKQVAETLPQEIQPLPKVARKRVGKNELLAYLAECPGRPQQEVADHFGVTRQAIGARIKTVYDIGKI